MKSNGSAVLLPSEPAQSEAKGRGGVVFACPTGVSRAGQVPVDGRVVSRLAINLSFDSLSQCLMEMNI